MAEGPSDELTPGEKQGEKQLMVAQMAYEDAKTTVSQKYSNSDVPEETGRKAEVLVIAVEKFQEALEIAKAEWAYTCDLEELNRALEEGRGEGQDSSRYSTGSQRYSNPKNLFHQERFSVPPSSR
jgi:hypothetical protein